MKKLLFSVLALAALSTSVSSCKKGCNTCTMSGVKSEYCSADYSSTQLDALKVACTTGGGTWD